MRHVLAAVLCKSNNCRPEAAESHAQASDSQRRISALVAEPTRLIRADRDKKGDPGAPFLAFFARSGMQCDKNDYRRHPRRTRRRIRQASRRLGSYDRQELK
jgi:hypothetical protein